MRRRDEEETAKEAQAEGVGRRAQQPAPSTHPHSKRKAEQARRP